MPHVVHDVWEHLAAEEDVAKGKDEVIEEFSFKDIRRSCETSLASIGVLRDSRSHVLSHGRTGVRAKHYARWTYLEEKRVVLNKRAGCMRQVIAGPNHTRQAPSMVWSWRIPAGRVVK